MRENTPTSNVSGRRPRHPSGGMIAVNSWCSKVPGRPGTRRTAGIGGYSPSRHNAKLIHSGDWPVRLDHAFVSGSGRLPPAPTKKDSSNSNSIFHARGQSRKRNGTPKATPLATYSLTINPKLKVGSEASRPSRARIGGASPLGGSDRPSRAGGRSRVRLSDSPGTRCRCVRGHGRPDGFG